MRDAGVDIEGHTLSHRSLNARRGKTEEQYLAWLKSEIIGSKEILEKNLGIQIKAFAYPYGVHNQTVRDVVKQAGFEAAFTVYGQRIAYGADPMVIGRYGIESTKPKVFEEAVNFTGAVEGGNAGVMPASATMVTQPMDGETVTDALPEIKANLATLGNVDPKSVTMRISGLGLVPATYDPATKLISYKVTQKLYDPPGHGDRECHGQRKEDGGSLVLQHRFQRCSQRGSQKGVTTHSLLFVSSSRRELARADRRHNWLKDALRRPSEVFVGGLFTALAHPEQPRRNHLIQPIHMYGERTIWLGLDN